MNSGRSSLLGPVIGLCLIIVGALFLLVRLFSIGPFWPLFIVLPGALMLVVAVKGSSNAAPLAIPGTLIGGTGAILLYQSLTHHWSSWAYAWTLYPALLGAGMILMGRLNGSQGAIHTGRQFVVVGLGAFAVLGLFFETAIFSGLFRSLGWPLILLVLGIVLLLRGTRHERSTAYKLGTPDKPKRSLYADVSHPQNGADKTTDGEMIR
jgi:hypothetical protein